MVIKPCLQLVLNVSGAIMAFVILQEIARHVNYNKGIWKCLSKGSMGIYLFHQQIICICIYFLNGKVNLYVLSAISMIVAIGISLLITNVLMKYKTTGFLIGEK